MNRKTILFTALLLIIPWILVNDPIPPSIKFGMLCGLIGISLEIISPRFTMIENRQSCECLAFTCVLMAGILTFLAPFERGVVMLSAERWLCFISGTCVTLPVGYSLFFIQPVPYTSVIPSKQRVK